VTSLQEVYFIVKGRLTATVRPGDVFFEVEIDAVGNEGDGMASVDGFTDCSSPTREEGETVTVRVEDVKPNFGFAERIDRD